MSNTKTNVKAELRKMLDALPDDLTWEDLQYHLYVRQKVERALADIDAGRVYTQEQVRRFLRNRIRKWVKKARQGKDQRPHRAAWVDGRGVQEDRGDSRGEPNYTASETYL